MSRVKKSFLVLVLLFSLVACTQKPIAAIATPTFTPFVAGTQTAMAGPSPWVGGTEAALAVASSPTPWLEGTETAIAAALASPTPWVEGTETALAMPSPLPFTDALTPLPTISFPTVTPALPSTPDGTFSPVFYIPKDISSVLLIGGINEDRGWLSALDAAAYVRNDMSYDFYSPNGGFRVPGSALEFRPICRNYFMQESVSLPESMIGVARDWISERRVAKELSVEGAPYIPAVNEWFQSQGASPTEVHINRILQTDIEGDGVDEVLLSASYFKDSSGHMAETGDYSVVLMRKVLGNQVVTVPLVKDYYVTNLSGGELSYPNTYTLLDALDLNRDGTLEVVVEVRRWEGTGAIVYRVDGQNVREVMRAIC